MSSSLLFALYLQGHLLGASVGVRLATHLASDPWTEEKLDYLPGELFDEIRYVREWARSTNPVGDHVVRLSLLASGTLSAVVTPLSPTRHTVSRTAALEAMRSMVLAKKAMWELGLALHAGNPSNPAGTEQLEYLNRRALHQALTLHELHAKSAKELFPNNHCGD